MSHWQKIIDAGYVPFVASTPELFSSFQLNPMGLKPAVIPCDTPNIPFFESYLTANSIAFESPDLKMPNWVLIDCILMQSALVGFARHKKDCPPEFLAMFQKDLPHLYDQIDLIPISTQIANVSSKGDWFGASLFSLERFLKPMSRLSLAAHTKALAFMVYGTKEFRGLTQYTNPALKIHGLFGQKMYIQTPIVDLHPKTHMSLVYRIKIDFDPDNFLHREEVEPDFWMKADDKDKKLWMQEQQAQGHEFIICPPFQVKKPDGIHIPIKQEKRS